MTVALNRHIGKGQSSLGSWLWTIVGPLAVTLLAVTLSVPTWAQTAPNAVPIARQFEQDAAGHSRALRDLYSKRGLAAPAKMTDAKLQDVASYLVSQRDDNSPGYEDGTAVLFYAQHDDRLASYLIGPTGLLGYAEQAITEKELDTAVRNFRFSLAVDGVDRGGGKRRTRAPVWRGDPDKLPTYTERNEYDADLAKLSSILLPAALHSPLQGVKHLIVVANGSIATNPFAALQLDREVALIDRMSVSISAGLFDLDQMIQPWEGRRSFDHALIVGDPRVPETPDWKVPPLPGAAAEAENLAKMVGTEALIGEAATKAQVTRRAESSSVLYFAAHGVSNPDDPLEGGFLMLSGPTEADAFLTAKELQDMEFRRTGLAVLSACQSGLGLAHDGGVIGLARSFQKAGVPRVIMSLWSVDDEATLYLMEQFQQYAMTNVPAEALRMAMLDARKIYDDPALWAAFTVFGTPR